MKDQNYSNKYVIHWAGTARGPRLIYMKTLAHVLIHFNKYYYSSVSFGTVKRVIRHYQMIFEVYSRAIRIKLGL